MLLLVKLIGIIIAGMGVSFLLKPKMMVRFIAFWEKGRRLYIAGILRIVFAIILLFSASQCKSVGIVLTLGILFLIGGIIIFTLGLKKLKSILKWWAGKSPLVFRLLGLIALGIGILLLYAV